MDSDISNSGSSGFSEGNSLTRQQALAKITTGLKKLVPALIPFVAAGVFSKKAKAEPRKAEIGRMLNVLLQMEFVLQDFYRLMQSDNTLLLPPYANSIKTFFGHHSSHVIILKTEVANLETTSVPAPFTFANFELNELDPQNEFDDFLQMAQILEDASTSLYKKFVPKIRELNGSEKLIRTLLLAHTAEARHSSYIRMIRADLGVENVEPWVSAPGNNAVLPQLQNIYENEENFIQNDIDISTISALPFSTIKQAWDEPCDNQPINNLFALLKANYY